jgi:autotransporter-associated beta strand protein
MNKKLLPIFVIVFACVAVASPLSAQTTYTTGDTAWNTAVNGGGNDFSITGGIGLWSETSDVNWGVTDWRPLTSDGTLGGSALSLQVGQSLTISLKGSNSGSPGRTGVQTDGAIGFTLAAGSGSPTTSSPAAAAIDGSRFRVEFVGGDSTAEYVGSSTVGSGMPGFNDFKSGQTYVVEMISTNQINFRVVGGTAYNIINLGGTSDAAIGRIQIFNRGANMNAEFTGLVVSNMSSINLSNNTGETSTISGIIAKNNGNNNNITKSGDGEVILTAANTFGGTVAVNNGTLRIANSSALGGSANVTVASGGTLALSNGITEDNALNISGTGEGGVGAIRSVSGANTLSGAVTLGAAASVKSESGTTTTFSGGFGGTGNGLTVNGEGSTTIGTTGINTGSAGTLTKNDAGTLLVSASGNYTGATTVNGGTVAVSANDALGTTGAGTTIASGATLDFRNINYSTAEAVTNNGGTIATTTGTSTIAGVVTLGANSTYNVSGTQLTQSGAITDGSGTFGIIKNGGGVLVLGSANTYDGTTELNAGTIRLAAGASLGSSNVVIGPNGSSGNATLNLGDADGGTTVANNIIIRAGGGTRTVGAENTSGTNTFSGAMFLDGDLTLAAATGGSLNLSGNLDDGLGSGNYAVTIGGSGRVVFSGATNNVNITGYTVNNGATLLMNKSSADAVQSTLNVNSGGTAEFAASNQLGSGANIVNNGTLATGSGGITDSFNSLISSGNITGNGTLTAATYTLSGGTMDANLGGGTLNITGNAALNGTSGANTVAITGGNLALGTGANRLSSAADVTISLNRSLNIASNQTLASVRETGTGNGGTIAISNDATLTINGANKGTLLQNSISGAGGVTVNASGDTSLSLYGTQSYTGATTVSGGKISTGTGLSTASVTINGGTFETSAANILGDNIAVSLSAGTYSLGGADEVGSFSITGGEISGANTLTAGTYALNGGTVTANLGAGTATASSGTTALGGTLGATTVNVSGGTLNLGANDRLANGATVNVSSGTLGMGARTDTVGALNVSGGSVTGSTGNKLTAATYNLTGGTVGANLGAGTLNANSGAATLNGTADAATVNVGGGALTLGSAARLFTNAAVTVSNSGTLTLGGNETISSLAGTNGTLALGANTLTVSSGNFGSAITGVGGILTKVGAGTLTLSGLNLYTGGTFLNEGTLDSDSTNAFGTGTITVASLGILNLETHSVTNLIINNGGTILSTGTVSDVVASNGTTSIGGSDSVVVEASGSATVNVSGSNVTVSNVSGTAAVNIGGTDATVDTVSGGTVTLSNTATGSTVNAASAGTVNAAAADVNVGTVSGTAEVNLAGANAQVTTVSGGTVTLSNTATGSRVNTASAGTVNANAAGVNVGMVSNTATVNVGGADGRVTTLAGGTVNANAAGLVVTNFNGGNIAVASRVTVGLQSGSSAGVISGQGGIAKQGASTLTLSGVNTYSGATTVEEGKLVVNGSVASSAVTVQSGAILGGGGTIGSLTLNGILAPGNSAGTTTANGNTFWNQGSSYDWEIFNLAGPAGTGWDLLSVTGGTLDLTGITGPGGFTINLITLQGDNNTQGALTGFNPATNYATGWMIASASSISGFNASEFNINKNLFVSGSGTFAIEQRAISGGQGLFVTYTGGGSEPIPEPGTWAAAALLAGAAGYVRWRRRKEQTKDA